MVMEMKTAFECDECGYRYLKTPWEPKWISRRFYTQDHKRAHTAPETIEVVELWRKWECARVLTIMKSWDGTPIPDTTPADEGAIHDQMWRAHKQGFELGIQAYREQVTKILKLAAESNKNRNTKITLNGLVAMINVNTPKEK